jgi:hypothetical protein
MLEAHFMPNLGQRVGPLALPSFWVLATQAITLVPLSTSKQGKALKLRVMPRILEALQFFETPNLCEGKIACK